jgi:hypothetical protein
MSTLLYPYTPKARSIEPDARVTVGASFARFEAEAAVDRLRLDRPSRVVFHVPWSDEFPGTDQYELVGHCWTRRDLVNLAGSWEAVEYYRGQLLEWAAHTRRRRRAGSSKVTWTQPWTAAGVILSYPPDEMVPSEVTDVLTTHFSVLIDGEYLTDKQVEHGYAAALAIMAMGGTDGIAFRVSDAEFDANEARLAELADLNGGEGEA